MSVLKAKDPVTGEWLPVGSSGGSSGSSGIPVPETAEVGQTIVVKSVDSNGKPTTWKCVDLPKMATCKFAEQLMIFEEGMKWDAYCDSNYNWMGFTYDQEVGLVYDSAGDTMANDGGMEVNPQDIIIPLRRYDSL